MCFYADYEWCASIEEWTHYPAEAATGCDECRAIIKPGETLHHLYQQEHEACADCDEETGVCTCEDGPCYGETTDYDHCGNCHAFLEAVEQVELDAGCHHSEATPPCTAMIEYIREIGAEEARKYFLRAHQTPEAFTPGYLSGLWKRMFGE